MKRLWTAVLVLAIAAASLGTAFAFSPQGGAARWFAVAPVTLPEPGGWALFAAGLIGAGAIARRRLFG